MTDQTSQPAMTPQPYPLFAAVLTSSNHIDCGRVIGWVDNRNSMPSEDRSHDWLPVIAYQDEGDMGIYHTAALVDGADLFLSDSLPRAVARAEGRKKASRPQSNANSNA
ncbi:hypothetical protein ACFYUR_19170 [Micromonospora haikouensis]|uniref:hypothetical protein n=1 Tax=Micromonospora haikouensis TaxID=686309 RepID=UPI003696DA51